MFIILVLLSFIFVFSSCSYTPVVESRNLNTVAELDYGTIVKIRPIHINDDTEDNTVPYLANRGTAVGIGVGTGALVGTVVTRDIRGGLVGAGLGTLAGLVISNNRANGQELYVRLDSGRTMVLDVKGKNLKFGDRCEIIHNSEKLVRINKIQTNTGYINSSIPAPGNY